MCMLVEFFVRNKVKNVGWGELRSLSYYNEFAACLIEVYICILHLPFSRLFIKIIYTNKSI